MPDPTSASPKPLPPRAWPALALLACPNCHADLAGHGPGLRCTGCGAEWNELEGWLDFRPEGFAGADWSRRQGEMEKWYEGLFASPEVARRCYEHDFEALAPALRELGGVVVDVGGGNGVARGYLAAGATYVDVDPSAEWLNEEWLSGGPDAALPAPLTFVLGVGEALPIRDGGVDSILSLYSLNHAADPQRVIAEAHRVLRPRGQVLLVVEDVEPRWGDLPRIRGGWEPRRVVALRKLLSKLPGRSWPSGPDHVEISERDLKAWMDGFELERRFWAGGYLALLARKEG